MREEGYYWVRWGNTCKVIDMARWQNEPLPAWCFAEEGGGMYPADEKFGASIEVVSERNIPPST
jgi:hypothetical protein